MRPSPLPSTGRVQGPPTPPTAPKPSNSPLKLPKAAPVLPPSNQVGTASSGLPAPPAPPSTPPAAPATAPPAPAASAPVPPTPTPSVPTLDAPTLPSALLTPTTDLPSLNAPTPRAPALDDAAPTSSTETASVPLFEENTPSAPAQPPVPEAPLLSGPEVSSDPVAPEGNGGDVLQGIQQRLKLRNAEREYNVHLQKQLKPRTGSQSGAFVRVELRISSNGTILKHEIKEQNASEAFLLAVELAIRNAQLDPLPAELAKNPPYVVVVRIE